VEEFKVPMGCEVFAYKNLKAENQDQLAVHFYIDEDAIDQTSEETLDILRKDDSQYYMRQTFDEDLSLVRV